MQPTTIENSLIAMREVLKTKTPEEMGVFFNSLDEGAARELFIFSDVEDQAIVLATLTIK